jgi:hypothetical protein
MLIISFFTSKGVPRTGLTPKINIVDANSDILIINSADMAALASMPHCYYYDFSTYNSSKNYSITVDGGAVLSNIDRYQFATNESTSNGTLIVKNLRYCEVLYNGTYYDVLIGINDMDEVDDVLQEWALANPDIGEFLNLPTALVKNDNAITILTDKDINVDTSVYIKS